MMCVILFIYQEIRHTVSFISAWFRCFIDSLS